MEILVTPQNNFEILTLSEIKSTLRIDDALQDEKLKLLSDSALDFWQSQTEYYLSASRLQLDIFPDEDLVAPPRQDFLSPRFGNLYSPPLAIKIQSQRPQSLSYLTHDGKLTQYSQDQINALPNNFFTVLKQIPLQFSIHREDPIPDIFGTLYDIKKLSLELIAEGLPINASIKMTILRILSVLYEYPDTPAKLDNDIFINDTIASYNCAIGIK